MLVVYVEGFNMSYVLPAVRLDIPMSSVEQGIINAAGFVGIILTSHFWGFMADTWGRQKVLQLSLGIGFIFSLVSSFCNSIILLIVTRFCVGLW